MLPQHLPEKKKMYLLTVFLELAYKRCSTEINFRFLPQILPANSRTIPGIGFSTYTSIAISQEQVSNSNLILSVDASKSYPKPIISPSMQDQLVWHYYCLSHAEIKATQKLLQQRYIFI